MQRVARPGYVIRANGAITGHAEVNRNPGSPHLPSRIRRARRCAGEIIRVFRPILSGSPSLRPHRHVHQSTPV